MINDKTYTALDFDKILNMLQKYAVLEDTKNLILNTLPSTDYETCKTLLNYTEEAYKLFYTHGICQIEYCDKLTDELERAKRGAVLTFSELLKVARLLRSLRILATSIDEIVDNDSNGKQALFRRWALCYNPEGGHLPCGIQTRPRFHRGKRRPLRYGILF